MTKSQFDLIASGRQAMERNDWGEAYELLNEAAASGGLDPDAFEDLARSAWWSGRPDECIDARERAYAGFIKSDEPKRAALMALDLAEGQFHKKATAIGDGWVRRAERLLASEPAFDDAQNAVDCAVEIQRTFARQRTEHGFAPNIRIGLHIGDVTEIGDTLAGEDVHRAARICAHAAAGEVLASLDLVDIVDPPFAAAAPKSIKLKGFTDDAQVSSLPWE